MNDVTPTPWQFVHKAATALTVVRPQSSGSSLVYSLPHSGRYYPDSFVAEARPVGSALRASEDAYVDEIVDLSPQLGVYGLACHYARAFCDVNRNALELDARLIRGELPKAALSLSSRVKAGFGVIARRLSAQQDIYRHPIDMAEVNLRLDLIYWPYHVMLQRLITEAKASGPVTLIDWHSMPSAALSQINGTKPDIVLGTLHGETCGDGLVQLVKSSLERQGLRVGLNKPFAGGYIVEHYGRPNDGVSALQIEINRAIYMDEASLETTAGLYRLKNICRNLTAQLLAG